MEATKKISRRKQQGDSRPNAKQRRAYRARFYEAQGGLCVWCKQPLTGPEDGELDRIIPGKEGGRYNLANLVLACCSCNQEHGHDVRHGRAVKRTVTR
jgi:5-methylcytosine-specific restriction endonuclease McrA